MGVFARLLGKSKATEEASTAETQADTQTAEPTADEAVGAKESTEAEAGSDSAAEDTDGLTATEAVEDTAEGVEIPKQQSAEEAADREVGEGAHT